MQMAEALRRIQEGQDPRAVAQTLLERGRSQADDSEGLMWKHHAQHLAGAMGGASGAVSLGRTGGVIGAASGAFSARSEVRKRRAAGEHVSAQDARKLYGRRMLKRAAVGAGVGAGTGYGAGRVVGHKAAGRAWDILNQ